jgi:hypothetical protein
MRILFQHYKLYFSAGRERNTLIEAIEEIDMLIVTPLFPPGFEQVITDKSLKPQVFSCHLRVSFIAVVTMLQRLIGLL